MKTSLKSAASFLFLSIGLVVSTGHAETIGGQEGKGGDPVEPLFIKAQQDAIRIAGKIKLDKVDILPINESFKNWLKHAGRLVKLQYYVGAMKLQFQEDPCMDLRRPRGTCFDDSDPMAPKMIVSYSYNRATTPEQAVALVLHEAGHFTGEMDHLFLSQLGVELAGQNAMKTVFYRKTDSDEASNLYTGAVFTYWNQLEAEACDRAKEKAEARARNECLSAGKAVCEVVSSAKLKSERHSPLIGDDYVECTIEAVVRGQ